MPIAGEETFEIPIFNGLGITNNGRADLCSTLKGFIKTGPEQYTLREDFIMVMEVTQTTTVIPITQPVPSTINENDINVFALAGSQTVNSPSMVSCFDNGTTLNVTWLNCNSTTPTNITQTIPAAHGIKAFCQYRDRYYASNGSSKIFQVSNFTTTPATALIVTDLAAVGVDILLAFKNRIFGIKKGRIYFTDLPAIGLYPETWNLTANFIDLPSTDYDITIHNAFIFKDKMYLFTDKGIYVFAVNGDPLNWSIQLVSSSFSIYDRDSVCTNKNIIFLTDQTDIFSFDGTKFTKISDNISRVAYYNITPYVWMNVFPFEEGIVLGLSRYTTSGGNYVWSSTVDLYYYNMDIWVLIDINNQPFQVIKAGVNFVPYRGRTAGSYIFYTTGNTRRCLLYDTGMWKGDVYSLDHVNGTRIRKRVDLTTPNIFVLHKTFVKYKYTITIGLIYDSDPVDLTIQNILLTSADMGRTNFRTQWSGGLSYNLSGGSAQIYGSIGAHRSGVNYINVPAIYIRKILVVGNTDNMGRTEVAYV